MRGQAVTGECGWLASGARSRRGLRGLPSAPPRRGFSWAGQRWSRTANLPFAWPPLATRNGLAAPTKIGASSASPWPWGRGAAVGLAFFLRRWLVFKPPLGVGEPVALAVGFQDMHAVRQPVEPRPGQPLAAKHLGPLFERQVRGHDQAGPPPRVPERGCVRWTSRSGVPATQRSG